MYPEVISNFSPRCEKAVCRNARVSQREDRAKHSQRKRFEKGTRSRARF